MKLGYEIGALGAVGGLVGLGVAACSGTVNVSTEFNSTYYYGDAMTVPVHTEAVVMCKQPDGTYQTQVPVAAISSTKEAPDTTHLPGYDHSNIIDVPLSMFPIKDQDSISNLKDC